MSTLPPEILDVIVDSLDNDLDALKNARLASSVFRDPCEAILFSKISLPRHTRECASSYRPCSISHDEEIDGIIGLFQRHPELGSIVRTLIIYDSPGYPLPRANEEGSSRVVEFLNMINTSRIKHLSILFPRHSRWEEAWQWTTVHQSVACALMKSCQSASLTSLRLENAPIDLIRLCQGPLQHLHLVSAGGRSVTLPQFDGSNDSAGAKKQSAILRTLTVLDSEAPLQNTIGALRDANIVLNSLEKVGFDAQYFRFGDDHDVTSELLTQSASLHTAWTTTDAARMISSNAPNLRHLVLYGKFMWTRFQLQRIHIQQILDTLGDIPPTNRLERLVVKLGYSVSNGAVQADVTLEPWRRLAAVLNDSSRFPYLELTTLSAGFKQYEDAVRSIFSTVTTCQTEVQSTNIPADYEDCNCPFEICSHHFLSNPSANMYGE